MVLRTLLIFCCWLISCSVIPVPAPKPVFGVQVRFQTGTTMVGLAAFLDDGRALTHRKILTPGDFVKFASGHWPSVYNPTRENLLEKHRVLCGLYNDSASLDLIPYCFPIDSLWKLRFSDFPFNTGSEKGWAGEQFQPSARQAIFLKENYGVKNVDTDYFIDTSFWKIMRDVQDSMWIVNYKALK